MDSVIKTAVSDHSPCNPKLKYLPPDISSGRSSLTGTFEDLHTTQMISTTSTGPLSQHEGLPREQAPVKYQLSYFVYVVEGQAPAAEIRNSLILLCALPRKDMIIKYLGNNKKSVLLSTS
jgi:hypothetical protein